jgi:hypothetical protein
MNKILNYNLICKVQIQSNYRKKQRKIYHWIVAKRIKWHQLVEFACLNIILKIQVKLSNVGITFAGFLFKKIFKEIENVLQIILSKKS